MLSQNIFFSNNLNKKKKSKNILITRKKFSELSGDNNLIHLDDLIGYNSIFGEKICNGCLVI